MIPTNTEVKKNLNIDTTFTADDNYITGLIAAATDYAEGFQHLPSGYYTTAVEGVIPPMSASTKQAVIMLASHWYESRDGGTGGFFANNTTAAQQTMTAVNNLLRMGREWGF